MQSIKKLRSSKKKRAVILGVFFVCLLLLATFFYAYATNQINLGLNNSRDQETLVATSSEDAKQQKAELDRIKAESVDENSNKNSSSGTDQAAPPSPQQDGKRVVGIAITASAQNGSTLQIRTLISTISTNGICTLTLEKSGRPTVTKTVQVQALAATSTCKGFDVPVSELANGKWKATISFSDNDLTGSVVSEVDIVI